jgi:hypothetical protein
MSLKLFRHVHIVNLAGIAISDLQKTRSRMGHKAELRAVTAQRGLIIMATQKPMQEPSSEV